MTRARPLRTSRLQARVVALVAALMLGSVAGASIVAGATGLDPSDVVLVFDMSNSILLSDDGTRVEFADALDGIADRVDVVATDLASGNAKISFVVFGRTAIQYPPNCGGLDLHEDPTAITRFEACLRSVATEYRAGSKAPVRQKVNTQDTDHVAALREAAKLLPDTSSRKAVIFFTDGENDPPGTSRDNENVVARVTAAYAGLTPLAILPVGLGARAGNFETELRAIYTTFLRDMEPCAGRESFSWPTVAFPSADAAGTAVALALQEVTCSFTVAPTPTPTSGPSLTPSAAPAVLGAPLGLRVLAADRSLTIQWLPPSTGAEQVTDYLVRCAPESGGNPIESAEGVSTDLQTRITGLEPGAGYRCEVAATDGITVGPWSAASEVVVVLGIPNAPSQPKAEALDSAARLTIEPAAGAPVAQYIWECTDTAGRTTPAADPNTTVVVGGLTNGETYQCVAYAENSLGRSPPSPASASFKPCSGLFDCNPWTLLVLSAVVLAAIGGGAWLFAREYRRRNLVWITAQVDGGPDRPLGWGPELGVRFVKEDAGWFATAIPAEGAAFRVRYRGENYFVVSAGTRIQNVHQGDVVSVKDEQGAFHQLILRRHRDKPKDRPAARTSTQTPESSAIATRIEGGAEPAAPEEPTDDGWIR